MFLISQALYCRLCISAVRAQFQVRLCGIYGEENGAGARFHPVLRSLVSYHPADSEYQVGSMSPNPRK
jgi:hypothetical protein